MVLNCFYPKKLNQNILNDSMIDTIIYIMTTIHFFGCARHDDVFAVKLEGLSIDTEMKSTECSTQLQSDNRWLHTKACSDSPCLLSFIGSMSYDSNGVLFMDTVTQKKLDHYEFNVGWLPHVTMLTPDGQLTDEYSADDQMTE